ERLSSSISCRVRRVRPPKTLSRRRANSGVAQHKEPGAIVARLFCVHLAARFRPLHRFLRDGERPVMNSWHAISLVLALESLAATAGVCGAQTAARLGLDAGATAPVSAYGSDKNVGYHIGL